MSTEASRERFEAWLRDDCPFPGHMREGYSAADVEHAEREAAWDAWEAARACYEAPPLKPKDQDHLAVPVDAIGPSSTANVRSLKKTADFPSVREAAAVARHQLSYYREMSMVNIRFERKGSCFWHDCHRFGSPMSIVRNDDARSATLLRCSRCDATGWYPYGRVGDVVCEPGQMESPDATRTESEAVAEAGRPNPQVVAAEASPQGTEPPRSHP